MIYLKKSPTLNVFIDIFQMVLITFNYILMFNILRMDLNLVPFSENLQYCLIAIFALLCIVGAGCRNKTVVDDFLMPLLVFLTFFRSCFVVLSVSFLLYSLLGLIL